MTQCAAPSAAAVAARRAMKKSFQTRGILTAVSSGMVYGMYTAFMTYAMAMGIWAVWYGENSGLSEFAVLFLLSALGAGLTDGCAAIWALIMAALRGKLGDFGRSFKTRPGMMMLVAAWSAAPSPPPVMWWACRWPAPSSCPSAPCARPSAPSWPASCSGSP